MLLGESGDRGGDLLGPGGEGFPKAGGDALDLEVPPLALDAVAELLEAGGQLGAVDGPRLGGDAVELAAVDGHTLRIRSCSEGHVGNDDVVVELGVRDRAALMLLGGDPRRVVSKASGDDARDPLLHQLLLAEPTPGKGHGPLDVADGDENGLVVCGFNR